MFKPSKGAAPYRRRFVALVLGAPLCALAGVATTPAPKEQARTTPVAAATAQTGAYQVRCWQHGRLLFEENHVSLPADAARFSLKVSGTDRNGHPIYVAETHNATCLIRQASDERAWPVKGR